MKKFKTYLRLPLPPSPSLPPSLVINHQGTHTHRPWNDLTCPVKRDTISLQKRNNSLCWHPYDSVNDHKTKAKFHSSWQLTNFVSSGLAKNTIYLQINLSDLWHRVFTKCMPDFRKQNFLHLPINNRLIASSILSNRHLMESFFLSLEGLRID